MVGGGSHIADVRVKVELDCNVAGEIVLHIGLTWLAENR